MPKISNEQKMQVIKDFLYDNDIPYEENYKCSVCGLTIPLFVKKHLIAIRIGDSPTFYERTRGKYYPIFIRNEDTKAKVLEKIQNTIIKSMTNHQRILNNKQEKKWK